MAIPNNLQDEHWKVAHEIAQSLVLDKTDVNELDKAIAYLRANSEQPKAGAKFFKYLSILVKNGEYISHSNKTVEYYESIAAACQQLQPYKHDALLMIQILGWTKRLMRYYRKVGVPDLQGDRSIDVKSVQALARPKNTERPQPHRK
ncbi:hypothetical protein [Calothrix sp. NIES-2098]|uniref:hypothetical protein n=1 Tax=Calothrix sp. NIES-2098 TaxID=1954171 RepID=UPI000B5F854F|nr:hypothetical protein NIES2098_06110 [Calothrix sp. NIES-2098]